MPKANVRITKTGNTQGRGNPPRVTVQNNSDESRWVEVQFTVEGTEHPASKVIISPTGVWDAPTPQAAYAPGARVNALVTLYAVKGHGKRGEYLNQQGLIW